jgi:hypothetical protein
MQACLRHTEENQVLERILRTEFPLRNCMRHASLFGDAGLGSACTSAEDHEAHDLHARPVHGAYRLEGKMPRVGRLMILEYDRMRSGWCTIPGCCRGRRSLLLLQLLPAVIQGS